jgi:cobalt-zinc-cadmium efflux system outer membrane protein
VVLFRAAVVTTALVCLANVANADVSVATLLSDPKVLAQRLREIDPVVAAASARIEAARESSAQARVYPNPQLSVTGGGLALGRGNRADGQAGPTSVGDTGNIGVGISEMFELGKRGPRQHAAEARTQEAGAQAVATLGARITDAQGLLGDLAHLAARRDVIATNLEAAKKLEALEKVRVDHQDLAPVEFERIQLDTKSLELQLRRADADVASALASCSALFHDTCNATGIDASTLDKGADLPQALPESNGAIAARPLREASRDEVSALQSDAELAANRKIPDLTVGLGYTYDRYEYSGSVPQTLALTVGIPLPFFDTGVHDASVARANAKAIQAQDKAEELVATGTVNGLLLRRNSLVQVITSMEQESLPSSTRIIEQTRKAFDLGQSRLADLLLVERAHRDLQLDLLDTRFELFQVRAALREALGIDDDVARSVENK